MKAHYKVSDSLTFEIEAPGQKELFKEVATVQEIFGEKCCGLCKGTDLKYVCRTVEGNDYFEVKCSCGAVLSFGQHKKGGTLFPKRRDDNNEYLPNYGWYKWQNNKS